MLGDFTKCERKNVEPWFYEITKSASQSLDQRLFDLVFQFAHDREQIRAKSRDEERENFQILLELFEAHFLKICDQIFDSNLSHAQIDRIPSHIWKVNVYVIEILQRRINAVAHFRVNLQSCGFKGDFKQIFSYDGKLIVVVKQMCHQDYPTSVNPIVLDEFQSEFQTENAKNLENLTKKIWRSHCISC